MILELESSFGLEFQMIKDAKPVKNHSLPVWIQNDAHLPLG